MCESCRIPTNTCVFCGYPADEDPSDGELYYCNSCDQGPFCEDCWYEHLDDEHDGDEMDTW